MKVILEMQNPNSASTFQIPMITRTDSSRPLDYTRKLEFPKFDGTSYENWVKKCEKCLINVDSCLAKC